MPILKIARMGHPVLAKKAQPIMDPTAPMIRRLINSMIETMIDANGAGLAAPRSTFRCGWWSSRPPKAAARG